MSMLRNLLKKWEYYGILDKKRGLAGTGRAPEE